MNMSCGLGCLSDVCVYTRHHGCLCIHTRLHEALRTDAHAQVSVFALRKICNNDFISMRVGVHTGSLCSGIIKSTRPRWQARAFDLIRELLGIGSGSSRTPAAHPSEPMLPLTHV